MQGILRVATRGATEAEAVGPVVEAAGVEGVEDIELWGLGGLGQKSAIRQNFISPRFCCTQPKNMAKFRGYS
jgi:hypothetical protein